MCSSEASASACLICVAKSQCLKASQSLRSLKHAGMLCWTCITYIWSAWVIAELMHRKLVLTTLETFFVAFCFWTSFAASALTPFSLREMVWEGNRPDLASEIATSFWEWSGGGAPRAVCSILTLLKTWPVTSSSRRQKCAHCAGPAGVHKLLSKLTVQTPLRGTHWACKHGSQSVNIHTIAVFFWSFQLLAPQNLFSEAAWFPNPGQMTRAFFHVNGISWQERSGSTDTIENVGGSRADIGKPL